MTAPASLIADLMHQVEKRDRQIAHLRQEVEGLRQTNGELADALKGAQEQAESAENELSHLQRELDEEAVEWNKGVDAL